MANKKKEPEQLKFHLNEIFEMSHKDILKIAKEVNEKKFKNPDWGRPIIEFDETIEYSKSLHENKTDKGSLALVPGKFKNTALLYDAFFTYSVKGEKIKKSHLNIMLRGENLLCEKKQQYFFSIKIPKKKVAKRAIDSMLD